ncbi:MAG: 16S rRNA (cytosine(1402)-N(4))-methyltransferase RsmH [Candidatus Paceibacterota bacterium]
MSKHVPVLLPEVLRYLNPESGETILDATIGAAGYAQAIATLIGEWGRLIGIDADASAITAAEEKLRVEEAEICLQIANFRTIEHVLKNCEVKELDGAVFDLGFRSEQLEMKRGFSFQEDAPLLMTFLHPDDVSEADVTAYDVVNDWERDSLESVLSGYGDERYAARIADGIITAREKEPIETTGELVRVIKKSVPLHYRNGRRHPATRTFQALRIAVNDEMNALAEGLQAAFEALTENGRLVVVSFHSLEDRMTKDFFTELTEAGRADQLTDKPITAGPEELNFNPRSRSAKLRAVKKLSENDRLAV